MGLFCQLSEQDQETCNKHKTTNLYKAGQILFYEGNRAFGIYCVFSGKIKLYKTGFNGRLQIVRLAGTGDLLGYRSLLADEPYAATAEAMEDAMVCFVDRGTFFEMMRQNGKLAMEMMKKLCRELRSAEDHVLDVAQKSTRERLASLLLTLKETYGKPCSDGTEIGISLSREEMAEMIGTTQETVIRLLSDFKEKGVLMIDGRHIIIPDTKPLLRLTHSVV
jgi:CRP-like cAMP-binding protein